MSQKNWLKLVVGVLLFITLLFAQIDLGKQVKGLLAIDKGGTGATTAAGARTNLDAAVIGHTHTGYAVSGANSDITSLTGLTTALTIPQGGTGATTAAGARTNLDAAITSHTHTGFAVSGANGDITSLTGLTTPLSVAQGGSGVSTICTTGYAFFAGASGVRACDSSFVWDNTNKRLGVGKSPGTAVDVNGTVTATAVTASGALTGASIAVPKQLGFSYFDYYTVLVAQTIPGLWSPEYAAATMTKASCMADVANEVIQITNAGSNALTANLTCGNGTWASTTSFSLPTVAQNSQIGLSIISGSGKRVNVSIRYTGN